MPYPFIDAPYGAMPVNLLGGQVFAGATREYPITYGYNTNIFYRDPVTISAGFTVISTAPINTTNTTVGVFLGCSFTDPVTKQKRFSQYYPAGTLAGDIRAVVSDDPDTVFRLGVVTAAGVQTIGSMSQLMVGVNAAGSTTTGSVFTGNSSQGVVGNTATVANAGWRILSLVPESQVATPAGYVSGTGTTTLTVSGLTVGQVLPIGTDVWQIVAATGQLQFTGSSLTAAATVASATSQALTVTASTATVAGQLVLIQSQEVLAKINFNVHRYNIA